MTETKKNGKLRKKNQYQKWKFIWISSWFVDPLKKSIFEREIDIGQLHNARTRMNEDIQNAYKAAENQMKIDVLGSVSTHFANQIVDSFDNPEGQRFVDMWDSLEHIIRGDVAVITATTIEKIRSLRYFNNMHKYIVNFNSLHKELQRIGAEWTKNQLLEEFFRPLPEAFDQIIMGIRKDCRRNPDWDFKTVLEDMELADFQLKLSRKKKNKGSSRLNKNKSHGIKTLDENKLWCKYCRSSTHNSTNCKSKRNKENFFKQQKAYYVNKVEKITKRQSKHRDSKMKQAKKQSYASFDYSTSDSEVDSDTPRETSCDPSENSEDTDTMSEDDHDNNQKETDGNESIYFVNSLPLARKKEIIAPKVESGLSTNVKFPIPKSTFIIDTGASIHITNCEKHLLTKENCNVNVLQAV